MMLWRLAWRNLTRNRTRSLLAIGGMAIATVMLVWNVGFMDGFYNMMIRGATDVEIGQVQVQHRDYAERPATVDTMVWDDELAETIRGTPGVRAATPRVRLFGIVGHEERSNVGLIMGVDPEMEPRVTVIAEGLVDGRWISEETSDGGVVEAVSGRGLSQTLGVEVGDELVVIAEGVDGSMGDALLEVVGIVATGSSVVDRQVVLMHLEEAQFIAAMEGVVHEAVLSIDDPAAAIPVARAVSARVEAIGRDELAVRPWQEVATSLYELLQIGDQSNYVIYLVIFLIVGLGVLNALRMSARERYREFGVMLAVGFSRARLFAMVMLEGLVLGFVGAVVGGTAGAALVWYYKVYGLNFGAFVDGDVTYMGVSFSERVYFAMDLSTVLEPAIGLMLMAFVCSLWPAVASIRLVPRDAITGRQ